MPGVLGHTGAITRFEMRVNNNTCVRQLFPKRTRKNISSNPVYGTFVIFPDKIGVSRTPGPRSYSSGGQEFRWKSIY